MLLQAFVPELAVQAFHKGVLRWLPGLDKAQLGIPFPGPEEHRLAGELRAVVADDQRWERSLISQFVQEAGDAATRDRHRDQLADHLPRVVIDHVEHAEPPPIAELVGDEVHRPALVRCRGHFHGQAWPLQLLALLGLHLQPLLGIDPVGALLVDNQALGLEHPVQQQIAVPGVLGG